jgi:hypothetical protein
MNNLILAVIAISFSALILTAGIAYLSPVHAMISSEATATEAQVQEMMTDYNTLAVNLGRAPGVSDYISVYGAGPGVVQTPNLTYTVVGSTIEHDVTIGSAANNITLQMQFYPTCPSHAVQGPCYQSIMDASQMSAPTIDTTCKILTMVEDRLRTDGSHSYFTPPTNLHCT